MGGKKLAIFFLFSKGLFIMSRHGKSQQKAAISSSASGNALRLLTELLRLGAMEEPEGLTAAQAAEFLGHKGSLDDQTSRAVRKALRAAQAAAIRGGHMALRFGDNRKIVYELVPKSFLEGLTVEELEEEKTATPHWAYGSDASGRFLKD
jgi:hypothetical protein